MITKKYFTEFFKLTLAFPKDDSEIRTMTTTMAKNIARFFIFYFSQTE